MTRTQAPYTQLTAQQRLDAFARLVDAAENGGATVIRIDDIRRALRLPARAALHRRGAR